MSGYRAMVLKVGDERGATLERGLAASQQMRGAHRLFAHMRSHMLVKMQEDPLNLHIFHLDMLVMKNKSNKDLRWPLLELLKSSKILFTV